MSYTPAKTVVYEGMIRSRILDAAGSKVSFPVYGAGVPVRIKVQAFYAPPARTTKKDMVLIQEGKKLPLKKPDIDNILKAVCDALNGVAYKDDVQIVKTSAEKYYAHEDGLWVTVGRADS